MIAKLTLTAAALAASLIAVPAFAQTAQAPGQPPRPAGSPPPVNPSAYNAIDNIRKQWDAARADYIKAQQAEIAARNNYERMTNVLLNVLNATVMKAPPPQPIQFNMMVPGQPPGQPMPQPPRP